MKKEGPMAGLSAAVLAAVSAMKVQADVGLNVPGPRHFD
jgi:hypothetical protein